MRRAAVLVAVLALLAGCGDDTSSGAVRDPSTDGADSASANPSPDDVGDDEGGDKSGDRGDKGDDKGGHGSDDGAAAPADAPACATVWKAGTRLARDYDGCMAGGDFVAVDQEPCSFGQRLVRYGDHFYAVRGGPVNRTTAPLAKDRDYRGAVPSCRA